MDPVSSSQTLISSSAENLKKINNDEQNLNRSHRQPLWTITSLKQHISPFLSEGFLGRKNRQIFCLNEVLKISESCQILSSSVSVSNHVLDLLCGVLVIWWRANSSIGTLSHKFTRLYYGPKILFAAFTADLSQLSSGTESCLVGIGSIKDIEFGSLSGLY